MSGNDRLSNIAPSLALAMDSVTVFHGVSQGSVLSALKKLLESPQGNHRVKLYSEFASELFKHGFDFGRYLLESLYEDENEYIKLKAGRKPVPASLERCAVGELEIFSELSEIDCESLKAFTGYQGYLAQFDTTSYDFVKEYGERAENAWRTGFGIYSGNVMFRYSGGKIVPLKSPDKMDISHLIGYEAQRGRLIANTLSFLEGRPAVNTLLYGDAGTGKSSSVKAVVNKYSSMGLRLVELKKEQLSEIPTVMELLSDNPLKFIIFVDDLSFDYSDDNFSTLKAILEGSASAQSQNTLIYVTSNRRHLVRESFSDREGDDIHASDTIQEQISMSERFGLVILYTKPSKQQYLEIVRGILAEGNIPIGDDTDVRACAFALKRGGFTPRAAEQFAAFEAAEHLKK